MVKSNFGLSARFILGCVVVLAHGVVIRSGCHSRQGRHKRPKGDQKKAIFCHILLMKATQSNNWSWTHTYFHLGLFFIKMNNPHKDYQ